MQRTKSFHTGVRCHKLLFTACCHITLFAGTSSKIAHIYLYDFVLVITHNRSNLLLTLVVMCFVH